MARIARPLFKRHREYVAVRPIRLATNSTIQPGEDVKLRPHQMRALYQRRRIGPKGHPWTEQALASKGYPLGFTADREQPAPVAAFEDGFPIRTESGAAIDSDTFAAFVAEKMADPEAYAGLNDDEKQVLLGEMVAEFDTAAAQAIAAAQNGAGVACTASADDKPPAEDVKPVKLKSQWELPGLTKEKFKTKKAALAWLAAQGGD